MTDSPLQPEPPNKKNPWYFRNSSMVVGFLFVGPLILPLVWVNPHYSLAKKLWATFIMVTITLGLIYLMVYVFNQMMDVYDQFKALQ